MGYDILIVHCFIIMIYCIQTVLLPVKWSKEKQIWSYYGSISLSPWIIGLGFAIGVIGTIVHNRTKLGKKAALSGQQNNGSLKPIKRIMLSAAADCTLPTNTKMNETPSIAEENGMENSLEASYVRGKPKLNISLKHEAVDDRANGIQAENGSTLEENSDTISLESYVHMRSLQEKILDGMKPKEVCQNSTKKDTEASMKENVTESSMIDEESEDTESYIYMRNQYQEEVIDTKPNKAYENAKLMKMKVDSGEDVNSSSAAESVGGGTTSLDGEISMAASQTPDPKRTQAYENVITQAGLSSQNNGENSAAENIVDDEEIFETIDYKKVRERWMKYGNLITQTK